MKVKVYTPEGVEFEGDATYVQIYDHNDGSFGMLNNHLPLISTVDEGYILIKNDTDDNYCALSGAIIRQNQNIVDVMAETVAFGKTLDEANTAYHKLIEIRQKENRARNIELAMAESELKKEIKKIGGGHL